MVGFETADDAGVYRLDGENALVQTVDFFTPIVDDPRTYGAIAAANSLSDIYAMGGTPLTALAITCFPEKGVEMSVLSEILSGGVEKLHEAGVALLGGHSVMDPEIKFGYAVTGLVRPEDVKTNAAASPGDALVLTKPLGLGIVTSGIKFGKVETGIIDQAIEIMTSLNRQAAEIMLRYDTHAVTDVTGNGLLGHAYELAVASNVTVRIQSESVQYIEQAFELAQAGLLPKTIATTWKMIEPVTSVQSKLAPALKNILLDPQTSGGLLISLNPKDLDEVLAQMRAAGVNAFTVGSVEEFREARIVVC